jgi:hypothetical protein
MNPLFQNQQPQAQFPQGNLLQQFNQFRNSFQGDPSQTIQQMLNSGRATQDQYNQAVQMAQQFKQMFGLK